MLSNVTFAGGNQACCLRSPGGLRPRFPDPILPSRTIQFPVPAQTFSTSLSCGEFYLPEISVFIPFPVAVNRYPNKCSSERRGCSQLGGTACRGEKEGHCDEWSCGGRIFDVCLFTSQWSRKQTGSGPGCKPQDLLPVSHFLYLEILSEDREHQLGAK